MKLNLCCGPNMFPGWLNVDAADMEHDYLRHLRDAPPGFVWPEPQRELAAAVVAGQVEFMQHDVRKGLPWPDNSVDVIYIGQAIEHFNRRTEAPALLRECHRILKPDGAIRLTTPDLNLLVEEAARNNMGRFKDEQPEFFATAMREDQLAYLLFGASGPDCTQEHYEGHFHCYTRGSLRALLAECGFRENAGALKARFVFGECEDKGMSHSFAIEAVKP